jgi:hypothetical protein
VQTLRAALQALGDALVAPAPDRMTAAEAALAAAVAELTPPDFSPQSLPPDARTALLDEALAAKRALARCRRLGESLDAFVSASLSAQGLVSGYDRHGDEAVQAPAGAFGVRG